MVALIVSLIGLGACVGVFWWYKGVRSVDDPMTWGESMLAATFVFFVLFLAYGVVPHQWLTWADTELSWRPDKFIIGPGGVLKPINRGGWVPFDLHYQHVRDIIAVLIHVVFLGINIWLWSVWQNRGKVDSKAVEPVSEYGRPLAREGV